MRFLYRLLSHRKLLVACMLFLSAELALAAGSGTITGKVFDKQTRDALPGANVLIKGTSIGASTGLNGSFTIPDAPSGEQTLVISYVGYHSESITVDVPASGTITNEVYLEATSIQGKAVIITAQAQGQMQSINQELSSNRIVNVYRRRR
ncbi:MAG TPA: carboxypeptidase-like regulatory domain-containing protein [Candidatus Kryptobacter bacterium]|nr:carboxypeptidase-like regulatory domain-containing protein [Candidatus Kryptobacter bacterium]